MRWLSVIFIALFTIVGVDTYAQSTCPPPNIGFEEGSFNHWQCSNGRIGYDGVVRLTPTAGPVESSQTMVDKNDPEPLDFFGGFPRLCPYGSGHSVQLGGVPAEAAASGLSYTFTIPDGVTSYNLLYYYAAVFRGPTFVHTAINRPKLTIRVYNITDQKYIDCADMEVFVASLLPEWKTAFPDEPIMPVDRVYYKDWTAEIINLNGYAGKQLRLEFAVNADTARGDGAGDFGYAYLDVNEDCASPITGNAYCNGQNTVTLTAPPGLVGYNWYKADDFTKRLGSAQSLTIPSPPDETQYALVVESHSGLQCWDTIYTTVNKVAIDFTLKVKNLLYTCQNQPLNLTDPAVTAGSSPGLSLSYYADAGASLYLPTPTAITQSGTYYVKGTSAQGCTDMLPVNIVFINNQLIVTHDLPAVMFPATVDITTSFAHLNGFTYSYYTDDTCTTPIFDPQKVAESGIYYIKAEKVLLGCASFAKVNVKITPPIPPVVKAPNAFTPNSDGVNDYFQITIIGYDAFNSLNIYNRYGQLVFHTTAADATWNGTIANKAAAVGTYYWLFEGTDLYYHTTVHQSGSLALIR